MATGAFTVCGWTVPQWRVAADYNRRLDDPLDVVILVPGAAGYPVTPGLP